MTENKKINNEEHIHKVMSTLKVKSPSQIADEQKLTFGQKAADFIALKIGSWSCVIASVLCIILWIILNTVIMTLHPIDAFPFILLNLMLSCIAALQAPIIMMANNRTAYTDRLRAEADYETNKKNEVYLEHLHTKVDDIYKVIGSQNQEILELKELINNISNKLDNQK